MSHNKSYRDIKAVLLKAWGTFEKPSKKVRESNFTCKKQAFKTEPVWMLKYLFPIFHSKLCVHTRIWRQKCKRCRNKQHSTAPRIKHLQIGCFVYCHTKTGGGRGGGGTNRKKKEEEKHMKTFFFFKQLLCDLSLGRHSDYVASRR